MSQNSVFALDIGTRSVVGVFLQEGLNGLEIVAFEQLEHSTRSMIDGQIHDVEQVAKSLGIVKERLEKQLGFPLKSVAVAAAGRALKTVRVKVTTEVPEYTEINKEDILRLELQAVQEAQKVLAENECSEEEKLLNYHCVGYSTVTYELDGYKIGSLFGQRGKTIGTEVIATFLPRVVVDSLFSALNKIGLELMSLTLEPIAASTVVVQEGMRQLNVALVDIGAGTSDIAITSEGSVIGYGMAPVAGDEITEKISNHYLVDFNQAETIKRSILSGHDIEFVDILGIAHKVTQEEALEVIADAVKTLSAQISERIFDLNGKAPQAVICIGGGSLTPLLRATLAAEIGLPEQRIAVRGREAISNIAGAEELVGPDSVTPIGIAVTAYENKGLGFARVKVNGRQVRIFDVNHSSVAEALLAAGIDLRKTRPKLGMALTLKVNDELKIIKGEKGKSAILLLNGKETTLDSKVTDDDVVEFVEAVDGQDASGYIYDVVPTIYPLKLIIEGEPFAISPVIRMNGHPVSYYDELIDNATIEYYLPDHLDEILEIVGITPEESQVYCINGEMASPKSQLLDKDEITIEYLEDLDQTANVNPSVSQEADKDVSIPENNVEIKHEKGVAVKTSGIIVRVNGEEVHVNGVKPILTDILTKVDVSFKPPKAGMRFEMKINGESAEFTSPLQQNDEITLHWVESS